MTRLRVRRGPLVVGVIAGLLVGSTLAQIQYLGASAVVGLVVGLLLAFGISQLPTLSRAIAALALANVVTFALLLGTTFAVVIWLGVAVAALWADRRNARAMTVGRRGR